MTGLRKQYGEWLKNILIVLLACSLVFLTFTAYLNNLHPARRADRSVSDTELTPSETGQVQTAATPLAISVCGPDGRSTALGDRTALDTAYNHYAGLFGMALETAGPPQTMEQAQVEAVLSGSSVYCAYANPLPLPALARWLGTETALTGSAQWLALVLEGGGVSLCYGGGETAFRCATGADPEPLSLRLSAAGSDGSCFVYETGGFDGAAPLSLLKSLDETTLSGGSVSSGLTETRLNDIAETLGFNPYSDSSYKTSDGTAVYSEGGRSLRLSPYGEIQLSPGDTGLISAASTEAADQIEAARALIAAICGSDPGEAQLACTGYARDGDVTTLRFDYVLGGVLVQQADGSAAEAVFDRTALTGLHLLVQTYALSEDTIRLMPPRQAALLAEGRLLTPAYCDGGDGSLTAGWKS